MRSIVLLFFLFTLSMHCNQGPAEDRGKKGCEDAKLAFLLSYSIANDKNIPDNDTSKKIAKDTYILYFALIEFACDSTKKDSMLNRYYRGYINGKE